MQQQQQLLGKLREPNQPRCVRLGSACTYVWHLAPCTSLLMARSEQGGGVVRVEKASEIASRRCGHFVKLLMRLMGTDVEATVGSLFCAKVRRPPYSLTVWRGFCAPCSNCNCPLSRMQSAAQNALRATLRFLKNNGRRLVSPESRSRAANLCVGPRAFLSNIRSGAWMVRRPSSGTTAESAASAAASLA